MGIATYVYEGGTLTGALTVQGSVVPTNTARIIKSATLVNVTAAPVLCTVVIESEGGTQHTRIKERRLGVNESYNCPELIGKGVKAGGTVKALGLGVEFDYTGTEF